MCCLIQSSACPARRYRACEGFTLLEVIVAVAIFAVIGLGSWQVLSQVISSKKQVEERSVHLHQLQKAQWILARDIRNIIDRPIRNETGEFEPAISSMIPGYTLTLTRGGWQNPLNEARSNLQRVAYALEPNSQGSNRLVRYYWSILDRFPTSEPYKQIVLNSVSYFEVQFVDPQGERQFSWPASSNSSNQQQKTKQPAIPAGLAIRMDVQPFGEIERLFAIREIEEPET